MARRRSETLHPVGLDQNVSQFLVGRDDVAQGVQVYAMRRVIAGLML